MSESKPQSARWYYAVDGGRIGPVSKAELGKLLRSRELSLSTLVWRKGLKSWTPASKLWKFRPTDEPPTLPCEATAFVAESTVLSVSSAATQSTNAGDDLGAASNLDKPAAQCAELFDNRPSDDPKRSSQSTAFRPSVSPLAPDKPNDGSLGVGAWIFSVFAVGAYFLPWGSTPYQIGGFGTWFLACLSTTLFYLALRNTIPIARDAHQGLRFGLFTGIVGIFLLLLFQQIALDLGRHKEPGALAHNKWMAFVHIIGKAYDQALHSDQSVLFTFCVMLLSVAFCEEVVKSFPIVWALCRLPDYVDPAVDRKRGAQLVYWGAMSGIGFGVSEAVWYCSTVYSHSKPPLGMYLLRFFGCVALHAAWSGATAARMVAANWDLRTRWAQADAAPKKGGGRWAMVFEWWIQLLFPAMLLHAGYNSLIGAGWYWTSVAIVVFSVRYFWNQVKAVRESPSSSHAIPESETTPDSNSASSLADS
jgi:RsiW-degrading membrane proteinase PrsW (M82 family)